MGRREGGRNVRGGGASAVGSGGGGRIRVRDFGRFDFYVSSS